MQNLHITRSSERAEQAELVLKQATNLLEQHKDDVGPDNYSMARGWLTLARDYRSGLEENNVLGRYQKSHIYLEQAQETLRNIEKLACGIYSTSTSGQMA